MTGFAAHSKARANAPATTAVYRKQLTALIFNSRRGS
jgi:hypothetical protein